MNADVLDGAAGPFADELRKSVNIRGLGCEAKATRWIRTASCTIVSRAPQERGVSSCNKDGKHSRTAAVCVSRELERLFPGRTRGTELAQGRFAVIVGRDHYTLIQASARIPIWLGREVTLIRSPGSIQWTLGRSQNTQLLRAQTSHWFPKRYNGRE